MAKKIVAIICGVSWVLFGIVIAAPAIGPTPGSPLAVALVAGAYLAPITSVILIVMFLIDYSRRPKG